MEATCYSEMSVDFQRDDKQETSNNAAFLLGLLFNPEDGGDMLL
jgi:hypothetical protein